MEEIRVNTILENVKQSQYSELTGPGIDYSLDPYIGCQHACKYCYVFRRQFVTAPEHSKELWGDFVDIKVNAPELLAQEVRHVKRGVVLISSLTDPYQPLEYKYRITRKCLEVLLKHQFKISILTKSDLINRDLDLLSKFKNAEVGCSITTDDDAVREIIEPLSATIDERISLLHNFHSRKIRTFVHVGPILPMDTQELVDKLEGNIDYALIYKMSYITPELEELYHRNGFGYALDDDYFKSKETELKRLLERANIRIW